MTRDNQIRGFCNILFLSINKIGFSVVIYFCVTVGNDSLAIETYV